MLVYQRDFSRSFVDVNHLTERLKHLLNSDTTTFTITAGAAGSNTTTTTTTTTISTHVTNSKPSPPSNPASNLGPNSISNPGPSPSPSPGPWVVDTVIHSDQRGPCQLAAIAQSATVLVTITPSYNHS